MIPVLDAMGQVHLVGERPTLSPISRGDLVSAAWGPMSITWGKWLLFCPQFFGGRDIKIRVFFIFPSLNMKVHSWSNVGYPITIRIGWLWCSHNLQISVAWTNKGLFLLTLYVCLSLAHVILIRRPWLTEPCHLEISCSGMGREQSKLCPGS